MQKIRRDIHKAFTLVELLVVIAIIGILVSLLLPAVQMVREAARRASCQNNIRQVALGLENFHSQYARFPHGWNEIEGEADSGWSWMAYTLPFVEQGNLYDAIDFSSRVSDESVERLINHRIELLFCPSSIDQKITSTLIDGRLPESVTEDDSFEFPVSLARTQYVGCVGAMIPPDDILSGL